MTHPLTVPTIKHPLDRRGAFEHVYRLDGHLRRPTDAGLVFFPNGKLWGLVRIQGVEYVTQTYNAKVFRRFDTVLADMRAAGGKVLRGKNIAYSCHMLTESHPAHKAVLDRVAQGTLTISDQ